jgi:hypothetical protein
MNFEEITELAKNNLPWEIIWFLLGLIFSFLIKIPQALWISHKILKQNRPWLGGGHAKRNADIFIYIWYKESETTRRTKQSHIGLMENPPQITLDFGIIAEKELQPMKLVIIDKDKKIKPIKNLRNKLVIFFTIFWLVLFCGDKLKYYKDLKNVS